jgi:divalent metal cation (Fe/Co/Zn/Cd) transporter
VDSQQALQRLEARMQSGLRPAAIASALLVGLGAQVADPIIGLVITAVILKITWDSWNTVRNAEIDLEHVHDHD